MVEARRASLAGIAGRPPLIMEEPLELPLLMDMDRDDDVKEGAMDALRRWETGGTGGGIGGGGGR